MAGPATTDTVTFDEYGQKTYGTEPLAAAAVPQVKPAAYNANAQQFVAPSPPPPALPFAGDDPRAWDPIINGIQINNVIYRMTEPVAGMRCDIIPMLLFHYPALRLLGYDLTQFTLDLKAYDATALKELQGILESVYPMQAQDGNKVTKPYVSKIQHLGLSQRGLYYFVPIKPTTSAIWYDHDGQCHSVKLTLLQWSQASMMTLKPINSNNENGGVVPPPASGVGSQVVNTGFNPTVQR